MSIISLPSVPWVIDVTNFIEFCESIADDRLFVSLPTTMNESKSSVLSTVVSDDPLTITALKVSCHVANAVELRCGESSWVSARSSNEADESNTSKVTVYGKVSLLADGQTVYTSPGQLFNPGESIVKLQWATSHTKKLASYDISAKLNLYDNSFETQQLKLYTFPAKQTVALSELGTINLITDEKGNTVAMPSMLYSSLGQEDFDYTVIAPDGTCLIGSSEQCLVSDSTFGLPGDCESVILEGQVYRIRYSGADSVLERFSITSVDPIVGLWSIQYQLEDSVMPHALAMQDEIVKIKNIAKNTPLITVSSD